jgi:uncharacterized protein GlcG (DUF336 family)
VIARRISPEQSNPQQVKTIRTARDKLWLFPEEMLIMSKLFVSKTAFHAVGIPLAAVFVLSLVGAGNAQLVTHKDITAAMAITMAETAIATCKTNGYNVSANVVGRNGEVIVAMRGDSTGPHTLENSMKKAFTARAFRRSSGDFADNVIKNNYTAGALRLTNIVPARGALPIMLGEETIGAIGVSGAPGGEKDEACAKAGIDKVADELK